MGELAEIGVIWDLFVDRLGLVSPSEYVAK